MPPFGPVLRQKLIACLREAEISREEWEGL